MYQWVDVTIITVTDTHTKVYSEFIKLPSSRGSQEEGVPRWRGFIGPEDVFVLLWKVFEKAKREKIQTRTEGRRCAPGSASDKRGFQDPHPVSRSFLISETWRTQLLNCAVTVRRVLANSTVRLNADTVAAGTLGWVHQCLTVLHYAPLTQWAECPSRPSPPAPTPPPFIVSGQKQSQWLSQL